MWFSSEFQSFMTVFHHRLLTREGRVLADGWKYSSPMNICSLIHKTCHPTSCHSDIKYHIWCYYKWTSWIWKMIGSSSKTSGKLPIILEGCKELHLRLMKKNRNFTTCNRLDLEKLGFWLITTKNLPRHWYAYYSNPLNVLGYIALVMV